MPQIRSVVWSPRAKSDLRAIWSYYARAASPQIADNLLREIAGAGERLAAQLLPGRSRYEVKPGLRSILVHPYSVFFRLTVDCVEVSRVLHERRDLSAIFSGKPK